MKIELSNIEIKPLTFGYVVVWKKQLNSIPPIDSQFCINLFGKPKETTVGFNQQGLTILQTKIVPNATGDQIVIALPPNLVLGYQKLSFFHNNLESFFEVYEKFIKEVKNKHGLFYSTLLSNQVGINIEFEIVFSTLTDLNEWTSKRFPSNENNNEYSTILKELKFQIIEGAKEKSITVTLQPRVDNPNALYLNINDHYGVSPSESIFDINQLKTYVKKTIDKTNEKIITYIL